MKNKKSVLQILSLLCVVTILVSVFACDQRLDGNANGNGNGNGNGNQSGSGVDDIVGSIDTSINKGDKEPDYDENTSVLITFSGDSVNISGMGATASGTDVTITGNNTFIISGSTSNGSITVSCGSSIKPQIVLAGLELTNPDGPAILIKSAKKATITLGEGTKNIISDGSSYSLTDAGTIIDGTIFSKCNLVLNGEGALTVNGNNAHAIVSKDNLTIAGGEYIINSKNTGICGKDSLKIADADITINAGTDALKSDNDLNADKGYIYIQNGNFNLNSVNDAIQAFNVVNIDGGSFNIKTTSISSTLSAKAIKGGSGIAITGGDFVIVSEDDAIHSNGSVAISGGIFDIKSGDDGIHADESLNISEGRIIIKQSYEGIEATDIIISGGYIDITSTDDGMNASGGNDSNSSSTGRPGGDMFGGGTGTITISGGYTIVHNEGDGIDSNGTLEISGGIVLVDGPKSGGNGSLDYNGTAKITGGIVIALGTSDMAQNFSEATQGSILVSSSSNFAAGTTLSLCDEDGRVILAFTSTKTFRCALLSAPEIEIGKTYTFYSGATVDGLDENGYAHNTTQTGGTSCGSVTVESYVSGTGSGMPGGGGRPTRPW